MSWFSSTFLEQFMVYSSTTVTLRNVKWDKFQDAFNVRSKIVPDICICTIIHLGAFFNCLIAVQTFPEQFMICSWTTVHK